MRQPDLPASAGVGFKPDHFHALRQDRRHVDFFEVHAENYMGAGGLPHAQLAALRADYAISVHGVGLSIGANGPLDRDHLMRVKTLCDRYAPESFSEHLAWSSHGGAYLNDLLPLPYTRQTLEQVCDHIDEVQSVLGRRMLLENPSTYVRFSNSTMSEAAFITEVVARTGCGLLLDVNNVFVSCTNHDDDAEQYLDALPLEAVGEIHLGGHDKEELSSGTLLIDAHGSAVDENVWALFDRVIARTGPVATLVEWDNDVPDWATLAREADRVRRHLSNAGHQHAVA